MIYASDIESTNCYLNFFSGTDKEEEMLNSLSSNCIHSQRFTKQTNKHKKPHTS